jgi:hypothetical protein
MRDHCERRSDASVPISESEFRGIPFLPFRSDLSAKFPRNPTTLVRSYTNYRDDFTPVERALYREYKRLAAQKNRDKDREAYNEKHRLRMRETRARKRAERQALATTQGA